MYNLSAKYCPELRKNKVVFKIMENVWATQTAKNSLLFTSFTSKNVIDVASL